MRRHKYSGDDEPTRAKGSVQLGPPPGAVGRGRHLDAGLRTCTSIVLKGAAIRLLAPRRRLPVHRHRLAVALVAAAFLASSCTDTSAPSAWTQPSFVGGSFVAVSAASPTAFAQPTNDPICPSRAPFNVAFGIIVRANGSSNVVIDGVQFRFTDSSGLQTPQITLPMPPVTIAAPVPTTQFGSALVQAGSATTVPLFLAIGCGTGRQGTIVIIVDTSDEIGHHSSHHVRVTVR
jgi:hypothetical protein